MWAHFLCVKYNMYFLLRVSGWRTLSVILCYTVINFLGHTPKLLEVSVSIKLGKIQSIALYW